MTEKKDVPSVRLGLAAANPAAYGHAQGRPQIASQLRAIDEKTASVREKMRAHCKRFEESWTAREAAKLWQERAAWAEKSKAPARVALQAMSPDAMMAMARRNIQARIGQRLTNINRIGQSMRNTVTRTLRAEQPEQTPELRQSFRKANRMRME